jgi:hypothetical protein
MASTAQHALHIFWLLKTTPLWLSLPPVATEGKPSRFGFAEKVFKPILAKYPQVKLRFFDAEAFSAACTDIMQWEVNDRGQYSAMVEDLRESPFWDTYFQVLHIIPTVEDGYAAHYEQEKIGA